MTTQLLIYETVVPLSFGRHRDCYVDLTGNYSFSCKVNSVPLLAVEFPQAAAEYAIVFAGTSSERILPAVILGVRGSQNLYLSKDATWKAKYIPAFIRRYPFVFSSPDGQEFMLCIDEAFSGFNREGRGQKLFSDDGKPTPYVERMLKFLRDYQIQFRRTQAFCTKVRELELLEPMHANVQMRSGERMSLSGFMAVSRAKLRAVPGDKLADLAKTDELELLYLHHQSMRNFTSLPERIASVQSDQADKEIGTGVAPDGAAVNGGGTPHAQLRSMTERMARAEVD